MTGPGLSRCKVCHESSRTQVGPMDPMGGVLIFRTGYTSISPRSPIRCELAKEAATQMPVLIAVKHPSMPVHPGEREESDPAELILNRTMVSDDPWPMFQKSEEKKMSDDDSMDEVAIKDTF